MQRTPYGGGPERLSRPRATRCQNEAAPSPATRGLYLAERPCSRTRRARDLVALFSLLAGLVVAGCATPDESRPSIVLWIVDTLRVDRLGLYGFPRPVSPSYDALAEQATVFEAAVAQSSWTRPTVATLLTGVTPLRHGVIHTRHKLDEEWKLLPERLGELGYLTAGFSANGHIKQEFGFDQGFDTFWHGHHETAQELTERALEWLDGVRDESPDRPFFIMVLSIEPHSAYDPAEPFRERFAAGVRNRQLGSTRYMRDVVEGRIRPDSEAVSQLLSLYEGEIAWSDHMFGQFREELGRRGLDPAFVIVADHGEQFGEHGLFSHKDLHREVLHIPFFVHLPRQTKSRRVRLPVQQADLLPTLVDLAGGEWGADVGGQSLVPLLEGRKFSQPLAETLRRRPIMSVHGTTGRSLVQGRWKLIETRPLSGGKTRRLLYDRLDDPEELVNLADERPTLVRHLQRVLQQQIEFGKTGAVEAAEITIDDETRRQLEALGYVD